MFVGDTHRRRLAIPPIQHVAMTTIWEGIAEASWYGQSIVTSSNLNVTLALGSPIFLNTDYVYRSADRGCSWEKLEDAGLPVEEMALLALSSATGQHAYAITATMDIYTSSDYAVSWELVYHPTQPSEIFYQTSGFITSPSGQYVAACGRFEDYSGYFAVISTDYGAAWNVHSIPEYCWSLAADANFSTIWMSEFFSFNDVIWKSTDLGATWTELSGFNISLDTKFACSQSGQHVALIGGGSYFSSDYGQTFTAVADGSPLANASVDSTTFVVASDASGRHLAAEVFLDFWNSRGFYLSHDYGETWQLSYNISDTWFSGLTSSGNGTVLLTGGYPNDPNQEEIVAGRLQPTTSSYCTSQQGDPHQLPLFAVIIIAVVGGLIVCISIATIVLSFRKKAVTRSKTPLSAVDYT